MKAFILILLLGLTAIGQEKDWRLIKEMSGEIPDHAGLTVEVYGARIARGNDLVKLLVRFDYPFGSPADIFKVGVPFGFDPSSISRIDGKIELNCRTLIVKPSGGGNIYQFNGKRHKSRESPFKIESGNILATYFCEQGEAPTKAPTLKPK